MCDEVGENVTGVCREVANPHTSCNASLENGVGRCTQRQNALRLCPGRERLDRGLPNTAERSHTHPSPSSQSVTKWSNQHANKSGFQVGSTANTFKRNAMHTHNLRVKPRGRISSESDPLIDQHIEGHGRCDGQDAIDE